MEHSKETRHRLNWKGMLLVSESLLYADSDTPSILLIPILVLLYLPSLFFSYLKTSAEGIELFYWPRYRVKSNWEDIKLLGEVTLLGKIPHDALFLKDAEPRGRLSHHQGIWRKWIIPLGDFRGWPDGLLFQELNRYIPELLLRNGDQANHE